MANRYTAFTDYEHYFVPRHLARLGWLDELKKILLDFEWIQAKLDATDIGALLADYAMPGGDTECKRVHEALLLSAHVLAHDKRQLLAQLQRCPNGLPIRLDANASVTVPPKTPQLRLVRPTLLASGQSLSRVLEGHEGWVFAVASLPGGARAISASRDRTLRLWDLTGQRHSGPLLGHTDAVRAVAVLARGRFAVSGGHDGVLLLWRLGKHPCQLRRLSLSCQGFNAVTALESDRGVIAASQSGSIHVLNVFDDHKPRTITTEALAQAVTTIADDTLAVSGDIEGSLQIVDLADGTEMLDLPSHRGPVTCIRRLNDRLGFVAASGDGTLSVWDLRGTGNLRRLEGHEAGVNSVAVLPSGRHVVSASHDRTLRLWDLDADGPVRSFAGHGGAVLSVDAVGTGMQVLSTSTDGTVRLWDLARGERPDSIIGHTRSIWVLSVTPDQKRLLSTGFDMVMKVWELETGMELITFDAERARITALAWISDDMALVGQACGSIDVWDMSQGHKLDHIGSHDGYVTGITSSRDGSRAVSVGHDAMVKVWDIRNRRARKCWKGHDKDIEAVALYNSDRCCVSASQDHTLKLWEVDTGSEIGILAGHTGAVWGVAIAQGGKGAVSCSGDGTVRIWDLIDKCEADGSPLRHGGPVRSVAACTNRCWAVSASFDHSVKLWDLESRSALSSFIGDGGMWSCAISPDGRHVVAGERTGSLHFLCVEGVDA